MSAGAFHGDSRVLENALNRLRQHCADGHISGGALFWSEGRGSAAGGLIESSDQSAWTQQLGLAPWLAFAMDAAIGASAPDEVVRGVEALLRAIQPGAQTAMVGSRVVAAVLDKVTGLASAIDGGADVVMQAQALHALHQRAWAGETVEAPAWRAVRSAAVAATDKLTDPELQSLAACLEAGAWDPSAAPATVGEVLRAWMGYEAQSLVKEFGWTPDDHALVQRLLDEMHASYIDGHPEETRDVFQLLTVHHPDVEARLRAYGEFSRNASVRSCRLALDLLGRELVSAGPRPYLEIPLSP